jgi:hypothetical protein
MAVLEGTREEGNTRKRGIFLLYEGVSEARQEWRREQKYT